MARHRHLEKMACLLADPERRGRCAASEMADVAGERRKAGVAVTLPDELDRRIPLYAQIERQARKTHRGIWASTFQMPWPPEILTCKP
ncbi:hypothetical protein NKI44_19010 [Mesorhizobium sp. M0614]|uniref:hypothetical protein n=1 Tax=Mesorhizobium sp. M0614 TaxID=2956970 RepID=UPI00333BC39A